MDEFSRVSGISRPTLSKFFNDTQSVKPTTRKKIELAIAEYDYRPNLFAINQNRKLTKTIGIVVPYLSDPFFAEMVRLIERLCIDRGYWPIVFSAHGQQSLENNALATLRSLRPTGALIAPLGRGSDIETLETFVREVPTVMFDSNVKVGSAFVGSNNTQSIDIIVEYLTRSGEAPCFFEMPPVNPNANKRREAYCRSMGRLGFEPRVIQVSGAGWDFERIGLEEGKRLIKDKLLPTNTVLCSNDRLAVGLIAAAYNMGLRVGLGKQCAIRVAGHDDHPWAQFTSPPLTTVSQDYNSIAAKSVEILFDMISGNEFNGERPEILFDGRLVMRSSA